MLIRQMLLHLVKEIAPLGRQRPSGTFCTPALSSREFQPFSADMGSASKALRVYTQRLTEMPELPLLCIH